MSILKGDSEFQPYYSSTLHKNWTSFILDSEPLHDIKGHLGNFLKELPYILPHKVRENTQEIIEANTKEKMTGADYRVIAIEVLLSLMQANVDPAILLLVKTVVRISELLYLPEKKLTPRRILQLYNCTWLHHELCSTLFTIYFMVTCLAASSLEPTFMLWLSMHQLSLRLFP